MNYFFDCATKEEAKVKYRKLAKELHPDKGGKESDMKALQEQYDNFSEHDHKTTFKHPYGNASEQAFKDNIRNTFRQQNSNTYYHQHTNSNELQRLRDENHMLRGNIYQLERSLENVKNHLKVTIDIKEKCYYENLRLTAELIASRQEFIKYKNEQTPHPYSRFEAFLYFIYFMIKGHP